MKLGTVVQVGALNIFRNGAIAKTPRGCVFEFHAIMVTAPVKLHIVIVYRLPGQLGTFIEELYGLLCSFSADGSLLVVFGDFKIHLEKPYTADFHFHS